MTHSDDAAARLAALSLEHKVALVSGADAWTTPDLAERGAPPLKVSDGPNGVRGAGSGGARSACFPSGICMGATFNPELLRRVGAAIAREARRKDVDVVLGPTINLHRTPLGGRNFECYGEDPVLSGLLASAYVEGCQAQGVGACPKHFVANDSEFQRHTISSEVDERTLREVYLRPFEMVVKTARPWMLMSAYNRLNGTYATANHWLNEELLRATWGFDGVLVSDWYGALNTVPDALGGLDLEMPGPSRIWGERLLAAIRSGEVPERVLDAKVLRLLTLGERSGRTGRPQLAAETGQDDPNDRSLAREAARQGMVLVKNSGVLPLDGSRLRRLALIGPNVEAAQVMGGGSAQVASHAPVLPREAITAWLAEASSGTASIHEEPGCWTEKFAPQAPRAQLASADDPARTGLDVVLYTGKGDDRLEERRFTTGNNSIVAGGLNGQDQATSATLRGTYTAATSGAHTFGLLAAGDAVLSVDGEALLQVDTDTPTGDAFFGFASSEQRASVELVAGQSVTLEVDFQSRDGVRVAAFRWGVEPPRPADALERAVAVAEAADAVVLLCGTNLDWDTEGSDRQDLALPGRQDELISAVCAANPHTVVVLNTGAQVAMPWLDQAPAVLQAWFPGEEFGNALVDLLSGAFSPSGRMPCTVPKRLQDTPAFTSWPGDGGRVRYAEGVFMGYRWYDARDIEPAVPFGHGLSYTRFDWAAPSVAADGDGFRVQVEVTNSGAMAGAEVVQLYVAPVAAPVQRPVKELRALARLELAPGATATATLHLDLRDFCHWDPDQQLWVAAAGSYRLLLGASSRDIRGEASVTLDSDVQCAP